MKTLINGIHAVESALKNDPDNIVQVWIAENKRNQRVKELINHAQKRGLISNRADTHAVIAPKDNAVGLTPAARKVASGAAETMPFIQVTNLVRTMEKLKKEGIWFVGTSDKSDGDVYTYDFKSPSQTLA